MYKITLTYTAPINPVILYSTRITVSNKIEQDEVHQSP